MSEAVAPVAPTGGGRRFDPAALAVAGFLFALALIIFVDAGRITAGVASYSRVGPEVFPYGVSAFLALLAAFTFVSALSGAGTSREKPDPRPVLWIVGGLAAEIALVSVAGFSIATGAVFAATAAAFGRRRVWLTYPLGVAIALAVWLVFALALKLVLPSGPLERGAYAAALQVIDAIALEGGRLFDFVGSFF